MGTHRPHDCLNFCKRQVQLRQGPGCCEFIKKTDHAFSRCYWHPDGYVSRGSHRENNAALCREVTCDVFQSNSRCSSASNRAASKKLTADPQECANFCVSQEDFLKGGSTTSGCCS